MAVSLCKHIDKIIVRLTQKYPSWIKITEEKNHIIKKFKEFAKCASPHKKVFVCTCKRRSDCPYMNCYWLHFDYPHRNDHCFAFLWAWQTKNLGDVLDPKTNQFTPVVEVFLTEINAMLSAFSEKMSLDVSPSHRIPPESMTRTWSQATPPPVSATSPPVSATSPPASAAPPPAPATPPPVPATTPPAPSAPPPASATPEGVMSDMLMSLISSMNRFTPAEKVFILKEIFKPAPPQSYEVEDMYNSLMLLMFNARLLDPMQKLKLASAIIAPAVMLPS